MKKLAFVVNNPNYFVSHRMPIGIELISRGFEVHIIAPGDCPDILKNHNFIFHSVELSRKGLNPIHELISIVSLSKLFLLIKPDLVHLVTIKPYLYGGIAARIAGVPAVVSAVAGLGTIFIDSSYKYKFLRLLLWFFYRLAFRHNNQKIIFQNSFDQLTLSKWIKIPYKKTALIKGSGIDLEKFNVKTEKIDTPVVSMVTRLLKDKGVLEFINAARILHSQNILVRMCLVGNLDKGNKTSISQSELDEWVNQGLIEWWGFREDIENVYAESNIACLPSYREGLPKSLIEAAACGRPIITTDVPGCRDVIKPGISGILVPIKDEVALAGAIQELVENPIKRRSMGAAGRKLAENEFGIQDIINAHLEIYNELLSY